MKFDKPIQQYYPEETSVCFGCGRNNPDGLHIESMWDGAVGVSHFTPKDAHLAYPGIVYGGLLASLVDCHSIGTAIAAMYTAAGYMPGDGPVITCVTGQLNISYRKPTPTGVMLVAKATPVEVSERKAIIHCDVFAGDTLVVHGEVVAVRVQPDAVVGGHQPRPDEQTTE